MMHSKILPGARKDIRDAMRYYARERHDLDLEYLAEVEAAVALLLQNPYIGAPYRIEPFRKYVLTRFPYQLFYYIENEALTVIALAHHHREPDYWIDRPDQPPS